MNKMRSSKHDRFKQSHTLFLEGGMILALLFMIAAANIQMETEPPQPIKIDDEDPVVIDHPVNTKEKKIPPPPAKPVIPVEVVDDTPIKDENIDFGMEDIFGDELQPLPPELKKHDNENVPFEKVEQKPELVEGISVQYPKLAKKLGIEGRVVVEFVVNKKGEVKNPEVILGLPGGCNEAALTAIKKLKFIPGKQRGRPVPVKMTMTIQFRLQH